jgi:hypothetical protein
LVTFTTEASTEKSKKSMDESKNGSSNNGRSKNTELQIWSSLGLGRKESAGIYRGRPLVPVGGSNRD